jgi:hypothetical protein
MYISKIPSPSFLHSTHCAGPFATAEDCTLEFCGLSHRPVARPHSFPLRATAPRSLTPSVPLITHNQASNTMCLLAQGAAVAAPHATAYATIPPAPTSWSQPMMSPPICSFTKSDALDTSAELAIDFANHNKTTAIETQHSGSSGIWNLPASAISCPPDFSRAPSGRYGAHTSLCATSTESFLSFPDCDAVSRGSGPPSDNCAAMNVQRARPVSESACNMRLQHRQNACAYVQHLPQVAVLSPNAESSWPVADEDSGYDSEGYADWMPDFVPEVVPVVLTENLSKAALQEHQAQAHYTFVDSPAMMLPHLCQELSSYVVTARRQEHCSASASGLPARQGAHIVVRCRAPSARQQGMHAVCEGAQEHPSVTMAEHPARSGVDIAGRLPCSSQPGEAASSAEGSKLDIVKKLTCTRRRWSLADSSVRSHLPALQQRMTCT